MLFREARPASAGWNVTKTLAQTAVFWGVLLVLLPWAIVSLEGVRAFPPQRWLGIGLFAAGGALGLLSGCTMATSGEGTPLPLDHPRRLVVAGPYGRVRNPMAVGGIAQGVAVGLFAGSFLVIAYSVAGASLWHWGIRPFEERHLRARFGEEYEAYRRRVPLWVPRLRRARVSRGFRLRRGE